MNHTGRGQYKKQAPVTLKDREAGFWQKVQKGDGCWIWHGKRNPRHPYGQFYVGRNGSRYVELRAHRAAWMLANGQIPDGLHVCHRCDNPICVRPDHLFLGTRSDNMKDMVAKGRGVSPFTTQTHCIRGHAFTPENTTVWRNKKKCRACTNERERAARRRA